MLSSDVGQAMCLLRLLMDTLRRLPNLQGKLAGFVQNVLMRRPGLICWTCHRRLYLVIKQTAAVSGRSGKSTP